METKNLDIYGSAPVPWSRARDALAAGRGPGFTFFVGTVCPDATPHAAGVGAVWADDTLWFVTGPRTRKARNLAANSACTISARLPDIDVVLEGRAERVTEANTLERLAGFYREAGWPAEVDGDGVHGAIQRAERRTAAMAPVPRHGRHRVRRGCRGAVRRNALAVRRLG